ncbi:MAG: NUDIX hydrolase [Deltaproteobacteria bacterium]|nr:NUDIX hydrolase [Deltaproteobacteria bacterium]
MRRVQVPSPLDRAIRLAYKSAYRAMRVYWAVRHPNTHGALVGIWHQGQILLVKNSYVPYRSLPGGYVRPGEPARQAALRELREELGLTGLREEDLVPSVDITHDWEGKRDHVEIFFLEVDAIPEVDIDNREVVDWGLYTPRQALDMHLFPPVVAHIREVMARAGK